MSPIGYESIEVTVNREFFDTVTISTQLCVAGCDFSRL